MHIYSADDEEDTFRRGLNDLEPEKKKSERRRRRRTWTGASTRLGAATEINYPSQILYNVPPLSRDAEILIMMSNRREFFIKKEGKMVTCLRF